MNKFGSDCKKEEKIVETDSKVSSSLINPYRRPSYLCRKQIALLKSAKLSSTGSYRNCRLPHYSIENEEDKNKTKICLDKEYIESKFKKINLKSKSPNGIDCKSKLMNQDKLQIDNMVEKDGGNENKEARKNELNVKKFSFNYFSFHLFSDAMVWHGYRWNIS